MKKKSNMKISDEWYGRLLSMPGIFLIFLLIVLPVIFLIGLAFLRYNFVTPVAFVGFKNFSNIFSDRLLTHSLKITGIYTLGVTSLSLVFALTIAYGLHRLSQRRLSTLYRTLAILPFAVPLVLSGLIWRWLLDPAIGVMNYLAVQLTPLSEPINIFGNSTTALLGVILADAWIKIPFMTIFILAAMDGINENLYEAAAIDGATTVTKFIYITLPLARNGILYGVLITAMFSFRTIDAIWSMTRGGPGKATYHIGIYILDRMLSLMNLGQAAVIGIIVFVCISGFSIAMLSWMRREQ
jgi:multiple sugar transport system permease protein